jgi:mannan endo-1,4-beta-mannosidase
MYDRYVNHHKLNNLLWVWNPNAPRGNAGPYQDYFPGLDVVDILAADVYRNDYKQSHHDDLLKLGQGKPIALGECGGLPTPEILDQQPQWAWFMCWSGFLYNKNKSEDVRRLYNDPRVLTLDEVSWK